MTMGPGLPSNGVRDEMVEEGAPVVSSLASAQDRAYKTLSH
jgi:hypothetical protein